MKHFMMLSDLYGRIGQMLAEHGDAPIGTVVQNKYGDNYLHPSDLIEPNYCYIHIAPFYQDLDYSKPPKWLVAVDAKGIPFPTINNRFETYEESCEAAIKYVLENLI